MVGTYIRFLLKSIADDLFEVSEFLSPHFDARGLEFSVFIDSLLDEVHLLVELLELSGRQIFGFEKLGVDVLHLVQEFLNLRRMRYPIVVTFLGTESRARHLFSIVRVWFFCLLLVVHDNFVNCLLPFKPILETKNLTC